MMVYATLVVAALVAVSSAVSISSQLIDPDPSVALLQELNKLRVSVINPELHKEIPNPLNIDVSASGKADAGCIIPGPFHKCICHADAKYDVDIKQIDNANNLMITNFTNATLVANNLTNYNVSITGLFSESGVKGSGKVHASVSACGISPSASGSASLDVSASGKLALGAVINYNLTGNCIDVKFSSAKVKVDSCSVSDIKVDIDLGPIHIPVGSIINLIGGLKDDIAKAIEGQLNSEISKLLPAALNLQIPCIPTNKTTMSTF